MAKRVSEGPVTRYLVVPVSRRARPYAPYVLRYPVPLYGYMGGVASYWDYYRTAWPGRGNDEESTR